MIATGMLAQVADFGLTRCSNFAQGSGKDNDNGKSTAKAKGRHTGTSTGTIDGGGDGGSSDDEDDFEYYRSQQGIFPVRWTAPECMETLKFTVASDVYSFGIVMVEMYQNGAQPYLNLKKTSEVILHVSDAKYGIIMHLTVNVYELPLKKGAILSFVQMQAAQRCTLNESDSCFNVS